MNDKTGAVDRVGRLAELFAVLVDLDQAAGSDLFKQHAVGIDQKVVLGAGDAGADVGEDQVAPTIGGDQAVAGCQVNTQLPFFGADLALE